MSRNVIDVFEQIVRENEDKIAVSCHDKAYSFSELRANAIRLAQYIRQKEITKKPIGVLVERDIDTVVAFLGILYSGNWYIPLDPDMPREKMSCIFSEVSFDMILGEKNRIQEYCGLYEDIDFVDVSAIVSKTGDCDESDMTYDIDSEEPLYMVYTSGSTGVPKGVLKSHGAMLSFVDAYDREFGFDSSEVIGNQTPLFFDASAKDLYLMICRGCRLEIIPTEYFSLPPELIDYLNEKKVTFASWVPTAISIVARLNPFSMVKPLYLKRLFFVGEVMQMKYLNKWIEALPDIEYVNLYGSSEVAGISLYYKINRAFNNEEILPLGRPLSNCEILLISDGARVNDKNKQGEIYVSSDALAIKYYNDAEKTDASFVIRDFGTGMKRYYKSGDLAYYDENGDIVFSSRNDFQIKHMGHRIELGEIESVANTIDGVNSVCCVYNADKKKIYLFCELNEDCKMTDKDVLHALKRMLVFYMVPQKVIVMDKLPINPNGKLDRKLLKSMTE